MTAAAHTAANATDTATAYDALHEILRQRSTGPAARAASIGLRAIDRYQPEIALEIIRREMGPLA